MLTYFSNSLPQAISLFLLHRMFNLTTSYFAIQPTTPLIPSFYFLLLPSLLLLLNILVPFLTNFLSSLDEHQSSIYVHIGIYVYPFPFPRFSLSSPLYHCIHSSHYSTSQFPSLQHKLNSQLTSFLPPWTQFPLFLSTYLCLSSQLPFLPAYLNFLQSFVHILLLLPKSKDCSPSRSLPSLTTAPVTSYSTVSYSIAQSLSPHLLLQHLQHCTYTQLTASPLLLPLTSQLLHKCRNFL